MPPFGVNRTADCYLSIGSKGVTFGEPDHGNANFSVRGGDRGPGGGNAPQSFLTFRFAACGLSNLAMWVYFR